MEIINLIRTTGGDVHTSLSLTPALPISSSSNPNPVDASHVHIRGLFATSLIKKGALLLTIPKVHIITPEAYTKPTSDEKKKENDDDEPSDWLKLVLHLMTHLKNQNTSPYAAYLASLPDEYETLLDWNGNEFEYLKGTSLYDVAKGGLEGVRRSFDDGVKKYITDDDDGDGDNDDFEVFLKAVKCVVTRGFNTLPASTSTLASTSTSASASASTAMTNGPYLVPVIDLLNHNATKKCTTLQVQDNGDFYMLAERDICSGEEIYHAYGEGLTNGELLRTYGFCECEFGGGEAGGFEVGLEEVYEACCEVAQVFKKAMVNKDANKEGEDEGEEEDEIWDPSLYLTEKQHYLTNLPSNLIPKRLTITPKNYLSSELITAITILLLPYNTDIFTSLFPDYTNPDNNNSEDEDEEITLLEVDVILSEGYLGGMVLSAIVKLCDVIIKRYGFGSVADRRKVIADGGSGGRVRAAAVVRVEEMLGVEGLKRKAVEFIDRDDGEVEGKGGELEVEVVEGVGVVDSKGTETIAIANATNDETTASTPNSTSSSSNGGSKRFKLF